MALHESYETQVHVSRQGSGRIAMTPTEVVGLDLPPWLSAARTWFVTAWNAYGEPCTLAENLARTFDLRQAVIELRARHVGDVVTAPPDLSWVEDAMVVDGLDIGEAAALGRSFGQPAVSALGPGQLAIVPTGVRDDLRAVTLNAELREWSSGCPLRPGEAGTCQGDGGPWGSAAIHAAALWATHRSVVLPRLGCGVCLDGRSEHDPFSGRGAPSVLDQPALPSRYGGYSWTSASTTSCRDDGATFDVDGSDH
jgi:hypothetical protein